MKVVFTTKKRLTALFVLGGIVIIILSNGCVASKQISDKTGVQLWAENCQRCHNTPSPNSFSREQWKTIGMHMQSRSMLTNEERDKIVAYLQN
ncbi:MAG: cytochrome c [Chitinophagaceae bacterium]